MKSFIGKLVLKIMGWKSDYPDEYHVDKSVLIAAPHTSNWDLLLALAVFWEQKIQVKYFIKDSFTKGIHGKFFKMLGAIGVDRSRTGNLVHHAAATIKKMDKIALMVPAEGTRSRVEKWKTGYLDYKNKIAGVGGLIQISSDYESDMKKIEDFYRPISAKYPEKYNKKIF